MTNDWVQHIGDDQLIYGMPKHMSSSAESERAESRTTDQLQIYWTVHPKPKACDKCQSMAGIKFAESRNGHTSTASARLRGIKVRPKSVSIVRTWFPLSYLE